MIKNPTKFQSPFHSVSDRRKKKTKKTKQKQKKEKETLSVFIQVVVMNILVICMHLAHECHVFLTVLIGSRVPISHWVRDYYKCASYSILGSASA